MHTQAAVDACARKADEDAEFRGSPLWRRCIAVAAERVAGFFLDGEELSWRMEVSAGHWASDCEAGGQLFDRYRRCLHTFERVSGSTSHMAFEAMAGSL